MFKNRDPFWKGFMAPDGASGGAGVENGDAASTQETTGGEETKEPTFDEILSNKAYQAEFDRRLSKALETQRGKMEKDYADQLAAQKTEAEKLAKMNAEQKAEYERSQKEKELADREANITRRELRAEALSQLGELKLPLKLADVLDYSSAEGCTNSLKSVAEAFREAVAEGVAEATKGGKTLKKVPEGNNTVFTREQIESMTPTEINANWDAVQRSLQAN